MEQLRVDVIGARIRIRMHVQPRASRSEIVGVHGDALKVRALAAPDTRALATPHDRRSSV
jgi:uncharacterized protein YggU (UPF0235/DUF167 family)